MEGKGAGRAELWKNFQNPDIVLKSERGVPRFLVHMLVFFLTLKRCLIKKINAVSLHKKKNGVTAVTRRLL